MKSFFFDRDAIVSKIGPAARRALAKFGAFVRRRAKSSLRYGKGVSKPGRPPIVHGTKSPLRELIYFSYDPVRKSVVIGPAMGGKKNDAPDVLEHGGTAVIAIDGRKRIHIQPRPFMEPAFEEELGKVNGNFLNILK